jgi:K+-transporting ATPase KdpF subunit
MAAMFFEAAERPRSMLESVLLLALCFALLIYLVYALLYPEKF